MMKQIMFLLFGMLLFCGYGLAESNSAQMDTIENIVSQYGVEMPDLSIDDALQSPQKILNRIAEAVSAPARGALRRLRYVVLPAALLTVMQAGMGDGGSAPLLACRLAVMIGCIQIADPALKSAQECIVRARDFSDSAAPVVSAALTAGGLMGKAAILSPAAAMIGDICQKIYAGCGLTIAKAAMCLSIAGGFCQTIDLSGIIRLLRKAVNWGAGMIGTLFATLITYAGANAFAQDTVAMRAAKYAFDSASGVIGGTSELWGGSIAGIAALRGAFGFSGAIAVLGICIRPMAEVFLAFISLRLLSAFLRLFGDGKVANAIEQLSGVCQMALMLSCSAAAIVIVLIGSAAGIGNAIL